jgi:hypothetical protein
VSRQVFLSEGVLQTEAGTVPVAALSGVATDALLVHLAGTEIITGTKTFNAAVTGLTFLASGLTGAVAVSRYAGATATGAPSTGTFAVGDFVIDQAGRIWVCTVAGTPGTWLGTPVDTLVGHLAGIETFTGAKTFSAASTTLSAGGVLTTSQAAVPTIPSPAANFGTITFSAASTDTAGAITFTITSTPAASAVAMPVVFNVAKAAAPKAVTLTMGDSSVNDPIGMFYVPAASLATTGFTIATNATAAAQASKVLFYHVDF